MHITTIKYSHKQSRNEKLFIYFVRLLNEEGEKAKHLGRGYFYNKCGDLFDLDPVTAGRIIRTMLKSPSTNQILRLECEGDIDVIVDIFNKIDHKGSI